MAAKCEFIWKGVGKDKAWCACGGFVFVMIERWSKRAAKAYWREFHLEVEQAFKR